MTCLNGKEQRAARFRSWTVAVLSLCLFATEMCNVCGTSNVEECRTWTRDVTGGGTLSNYPDEPFVLLMASSNDGHLMASYGYQYIERKGTVALHGVEKSETEWAPLVSYEVATKGTTEWKEIAKFTAKTFASIIVNSSHPRFVFAVGMDPFRAYIGKATWGRVVLENGDFAPIALEDLLPTTDCSDFTGNFKKDVDDPNPTRFGSTFNLISLVSFEKHSIGNFYFMGGAEGASIELTGRQTDDGQFWPIAKFEVDDSDSRWKSVQTATSPPGSTRLAVYEQGKLRQLRVPLDIYTPLIGKHKFGRITFSNGEYCVIRLNDLTRGEK